MNWMIFTCCFACALLFSACVPPNLNSSPPPVANASPATAPPTTPANAPASPVSAPAAAPASVAYQAQGVVSVLNRSVPFTVQVIDLKKGSGQMLTLRLALTNNGGIAFTPTYEFTKGGADLNINKISGVYLVDTAEQKKYEVMRDANGRAVCSKIEPDIKPGERRELFAQFPTPPPTTTSMSVYFPQASTPMMDVPIQ